MLSNYNKKIHQIKYKWSCAIYKGNIKSFQLKLILTCPTENALYNNA